MGETDASAPLELPRVLLFAIALLCGLFLALAVHIALTHSGNGLARPWRDLFPTHADELQAALAWWAIAAAGCLGSWLAILLLQGTQHTPARRIFRLFLGMAFFCLLAAAGHTVASTPAGAPAATAAANLAAMLLGGFMAFCTAHFALSVADASANTRQKQLA
jgi:hypothetical protein